MWNNVVIYLAAAVLAALITPIVIAIAKSLNLLEGPGLRKVHTDKTPRVGGVAIVLSVVIVIAILLTLDGSQKAAFGTAAPQMIILLAASLLVFAVGLIDDIRGLGVYAKLLGQVVAAVMVCASGIWIDPAAFGLPLNLVWIGWPITILWIVGITNAVNLIDGLDGLAAGIASIACGVICIFALYTGLYPIAAVMFVLLGSLTGFLIFNFRPARIFMGDSGAMFLGFVLSTITVMSAVTSGNAMILPMVALALGLPILDTLFSIIRRLLKRRSVFSADFDHVHHRLIAIGLPHSRVVLIMYAITLATACSGLLLMVATDSVSLVVPLLAAVALTMLFIKLYAAELRQSFTAVKRNIGILRQANRDQRAFERGRLRFHNVRLVAGWWEGICETAEELQLGRLELRTTGRDGALHTSDWRHPDLCTSATQDMILRTSMRVRHRRAGPPALIEVEVPINGSLESAARRVQLFARLLDEHSMAHLPKKAAVSSGIMESDYVSLIARGDIGTTCSESQASACADVRPT